MYKTVIITGAAKGIGLEIAHACLAKNFHVIAIDIDNNKLKENFGKNNNVKIINGSVESENINDIISQLETLNTSYQYLINNVGVNQGKTWDELNINDIRRGFSINLFGPWQLTKWWSDRLRSNQQTGASICVTSLHNERVRLLPEYSMSKAALSMMIREAAIALAPYNIRINGLRPGAINTWGDPDRPTKRDVQASSLVPLGRLGVADDLVEAALFLLDNEKSRYITGQEITVDGGLSLYNWLSALPPEK